MSRFPKLAIIGCGAVFERLHWPALKAIGWRPALLVDRSPARLKAMQGLVKGARTATSVTPEIGAPETAPEAAIVALPHALHGQVCTELLDAGIHVLVEKPMATSVAECEAMNAAAAKSGAVLAVGHMRRHLAGMQWVKALLDAGGLGPITHFDFREGAPYGWRVTTPSFWDREAAGGGVLFDTGAHTADLLRWWLGMPARVTYADDAYGGVEADCRATFTLANGAEGVLELSRTRSLRGTAIIEGAEGRITVSLVSNAISAEPAALLARSFAGRRGDKLPGESFSAMVKSQLHDFAAACRGEHAALVPGDDAAQTVALIQRCYAARERWSPPWLRPKEMAAASSEPADPTGRVA